MSMPVLTFGCTACDLQSWDASTWGYRFYKVGDEKFRMRVAMGWCQSCHGFSAIEIKPGSSLEAQLAAKVSRLRAELGELQPPPKLSWWPFKAAKPSELVLAEHQLTQALEDLASLRKLLPLMASRQSGDRCLKCESEDCRHLPPLPIEASFDRFHPTPIPLGISHPGCEGEFTVSSDGFRLSVRLDPRAYDLEGRLLPEETG